MNEMTSVITPDLSVPPSPSTPMTPSVPEIRFDAATVASESGRRNFLSRLAVAAGAVALVPMIQRGSGIAGLLNAQGTTGQSEPNLTDTDILNYALTLEYLEAAFYLRAISGGTLPMNATINSIDPDGGAMPGTVPGLAGITFPAPSTQSALTFFTTVRDHEIIHVQSLRAALGGAALNRAAFTFNFGTAFANTGNFLNTALALEDTGVSAYLGQAANLDVTSTLGTAGSILGVEAEHAGAVRLLLGLPVTPDNGSFDTAKTSAQILGIAGGFITAAPPLPFPK